MIRSSIAAVAAGLAVWAAQPPAETRTPAVTPRPAGKAAIVVQWPVAPTNSLALDEFSLSLLLDDSAPVRAALERIVSVDWKAVPLHSAIAELEKPLGINLHLDEEGLRNALVQRDRPVTLRLERLPARTVLRELLSPLGLVAVAEAGLLRITDREGNKNRLLFRLYLVADLAVLRHGDKWQWHDRALLDLIQNTVDREEWEATGGTCTMSYFMATGALVVSAPEETHQKVGQLLATLRASRPRTAKLLEANGMPPLAELLAKSEPAPAPPWVGQVLKTPLDPQLPALAPAAPDGNALAAAKEARAVADKALRLALKLEAEQLARDAAAKN